MREGIVGSNDCAGGPLAQSLFFPMSVASTKFARAAFALVEVLIVVAAIVLHLAIICIVLALPIVRIKAAPLGPTAKAC